MKGGPTRGPEILGEITDLWNCEKKDELTLPHPPILQYMRNVVVFSQAIVKIV